VPARNTHSNSLPRQSWRALRTCAYVLVGIATTTFVFPLVKPHSRRRLMHRWCARLIRLMNVEPRVHGAMALAGGNVLVVSNHISWLDAFVLNAVHPVRYIAKSELKRWPIAGWLVQTSGTLFIERTRRRDARRINGVIASVLAAGDVIAIFPEGTTTDGADVLPFKSSLLQPIIDAGGHVQPVALRYLDADGALTTIPSFVGDDKFLASFWRVCGMRKLNVDLHAAPALPAVARHRRDLARESEAAIRSALGLSAGGFPLDRRGDRASGSP